MRKKKNQKEEHQTMASITIPISKEIEITKVLPDNLFTKLVWRFLKFRIVKKKIKNPIIPIINADINLFGMLLKERLECIYGQ